MNWYLLIPIAFMFGSFGFLELWHRSRKDVHNNPVIFKDDGKFVLYILSALCLLGFAVSLFLVGQ